MRVLAVAAFAVAALAGSTVPPRQFTFSVNRAEVVVPVTVARADGGFVSGLEAGAFTVRDNGSPRPIAGFEAGDSTVTVGLVVDHSASMGHVLPAVAAAAVGFARAGNAGDEMFVVNFNDVIRLELPDGVLFSHDPEQLSTAVLAQPTQGRTALYDAVLVALDHLTAGHTGRRALVIVSDGADNASRHSFAQVREAALRAQAVVYVIGFSDPSQADGNPGVLRQLAAATGGAAYFPATSDQAGQIALRVAREMRSQYTLLYAPPRDAPAGWRKIAVGVAAPGRGRLTVRTRAGYYVLAPAGARP